MGIILSTVFFMILICVLVSIHELGHLIAARSNGAFVEAFSIGYGPVLFERTDRHGTKWRFSLLPLGGYVKMLGDADATSVREKIPNGVSEEAMEQMSLHRKKPWQRLIVAISGPVANFIFAIAILITIAMTHGFPSYTNVINTVSTESHSYKSGLRNGDTITKANDAVIEKFDDIKKVITHSAGKEINVEVLRNNKVEVFNIKMITEDGKPISALGITPGGVTYKKIPFLQAISQACITTYVIASDNIKAVFQMITAKRSTKDIGGIISIFKMSADSAESGTSSFIWMIAYMSIILGAINLLPIPVLDGGTVLISLIEWVIGRPLNKKFVETIFIAGLFVVAGLMLVGIWNDLSRCKFFTYITGLFG